MMKNGEFDKTTRALSESNNYSLEDGILISILGLSFKGVDDGW